MADLTTLRDAIAHLVGDRTTVAMKGFTHLIPVLQTALPSALELKTLRELERRAALAHEQRPTPYRRFRI